MPVMTDTEKKALHRKMQFLYDKGYKLEDDFEYGLELTNNIIRVGVYSGRYTDPPDAYIRFLAENEVFSLEWISSTIDKEEKEVNHDNVMETLVYFLDFLEKHYDKVVDFGFCYEIREKLKSSEVNKSIWRQQ